MNGLYRLSELSNVEEVEAYREGGFHPVHIGDEFQQRYKVVHKLGFGGSSTVWLARDRNTSTYVALKVIDAYSSQDNHELLILQALSGLGPKENDDKCDHVINLLEHFTIQGPNGQHLCLILPVLGPNIRCVNDRQGSIATGRRLEASLARKLAKQSVQALQFVHSRNICHGDLATTNILFKLDPIIHGWTDSEMYGRVGKPKTDEVLLRDGSQPGESAPTYLVEPCSLTDLECLLEEIVLVDFDCAQELPNDDCELVKVVGYSLSYAAPEVLLDSQINKQSEIWSLGAVFFELRCGEQLMTDFFNNDNETLCSVMQTFGKLPDKWWNAWESRHYYFDEEGESKLDEHGKPTAPRWPLARSIAEIGDDDNEQMDNNTSFAFPVELPGTKIPKDEVLQMEDLIGKMMSYDPESRLSLIEVLNHPWLSTTPETAASRQENESMVDLWRGCNDKTEKVKVQQFLQSV